MSGYPIDRRIKHSTLNAFKANMIPVDPTHFDNTGSLITRKNVISANTTINVPADYATIQLALDSIKQIENNAIVTIKVANGTYNLTSGINLNHPCGGNIQIIGNQANPTLCTLQVANPVSFNAISISNGNKFLLFDGFYIYTPTKQTLSNNYSGIWAGYGAQLTLGNKIKVKNFYYGINASYGSQITADYADVSYAGDVGIWAFCGSMIQAKYATSSYCSDTVNGWGYGFQAEYGSHINCESASATQNNIAGFASLSNSQVRALNTTSNNNVGSGYFARGSSNIENYSSQGNDNGRYGLEVCDPLSSIMGMNTTYTGNTLGIINQLPYLFNNAANSTGISSTTDIAMRYDSGANDSWFNNKGGLAFHINSVANTANRIGVHSAVSGQPPVIAAEGSDSIIDLQLNPQGGGYIRFGAGYQAGGGTIIGHIDIKDNNGTVRKLAVIS